MKAAIELGRKEATPAVFEEILYNPEFQEFVDSCLCRHASCDWGDISAEDKALNDLAAKYGGERVISAYNNGKLSIRIITESDRSVTTVFFPIEY